MPSKKTTNPLLILSIQQWVEWYHISISSGRLYGWYDADPGQCQLAHGLHHLGCRPERLPVCGRDIRLCQGACLSVSKHEEPVFLLCFLMIIFFLFVF